MLLHGDGSESKQFHIRDGIVMMGAPGGKYKNPRRLGQATQSLYVMVENADKPFQRDKKAGGPGIEARFEQT